MRLKHDKTVLQKVCSIVEGTFTFSGPIVNLPTLYTLLWVAFGYKWSLNFKQLVGSQGFTQGVTNQELFPYFVATMWVPTE